MIDQPPEALVRGCNDPISIGVLSDWVEEQYGIALDYQQNGWSDGFFITIYYCGIGNGYGNNFGNGIFYGYGFSNGNGSGRINVDYRNVINASNGYDNGHGNGNGNGHDHGHNNSNGNGHGSGGY